MSYKDGITSINKRYNDEVIAEIKKVKEYYEDSIKILDNIKGIDESKTLKKVLKKKIEDLDNKILDIGQIKKELLADAIEKDKPKPVSISQSTITQTSVSQTATTTVAPQIQKPAVNNNLINNSNQ